MPLGLEGRIKKDLHTRDLMFSGLMSGPESVSGARLSLRGHGKHTAGAWRSSERGVYGPVNAAFMDEIFLELCGMSCSEGIRR